MAIFKDCESLPLVLTVDQAADILGICRSVAYDLVKKEGLAIRVGEKRLLIPKERFLSYLDKQDDFFSEEG